MKRLILLLVIAWLYSRLPAQQVADTTYNPPIHHPAYESGQGPIVFIDEGHYNFHTKNGRYKAFANLLERDGYQVTAYRDLFKEEKLAAGKILVISNALHERNQNDWFLPTPSAFTKAEIEEVRQWVKEGGSLFLIADHMPLAGAAEELAAAFGFEFTNGFVMDPASRGPIIFTVEEGTLQKNVITKGRDSTESVNRIATFTGQAFKIPEDSHSILTFKDGYVNLLPDTAWVFHPKTPKLEVEGWSQGAYKKFGKGRLAVFGEAAMFTAQIAGPQQVKMGMSNAAAPENYKLLLNIIHWLDGQLE